MYNQDYDQNPVPFPTQHNAHQDGPRDHRGNNLGYDMGRDEYGYALSAHAPPHAQSLPTYDQGERYRRPHHRDEANTRPARDIYEQHPYHEGPRHEYSRQAHDQGDRHDRDDDRSFRSWPGADRRGDRSDTPPSASHQQHALEHEPHPGSPLGREHPYGGYDRNDPRTTRYNPRYRPDLERSAGPRAAPLNRAPSSWRHEPRQGRYPASLHQQGGYAGNFEALQGHLANQPINQHGQRLADPYHPGYDQARAANFGPPRPSQSHPTPYQQPTTIYNTSTDPYDEDPMEVWRHTRPNPADTQPYASRYAGPLGGQYGDL